MTEQKGEAPPYPIARVACALIARDLTERGDFYRMDPDSGKVADEAQRIYSHPESMRERVIRDSAVRMAWAACNTLKNLGWTQPDA